MNLENVIIGRSAPPVTTWQRSRTLSEVTNKLIELDAGGYMLFPTEAGKAHLQMQRSMNARMKQLKKKLPARAFVTKTLPKGTELEDGTIIEKHSLGVFRVA